MMKDAVDRAKSISLLGLFIATAVVNGLVTSGISVPLNNVEIADSHPVYVVPAGYAFSIWGIIYLLVGVFVILQVLPAQLTEPHFIKARPWAAMSLILNISWLYTFSFELYWISGIMIVGYALALLKCLEEFNVNYISGKQSWQVKLGSAAFSANGAWVCVASGLQVCVNLMDEGWLPSVDFSRGILFAVTLLACYNVYRRADVLYAFVSAWALGGIISNQGASSDWGAASKICSEACMSKMNICSSRGIFYQPCLDFTTGTGDEVQLIAKSAGIVSFCYVALALVLVSLAAGLAKAGYDRYTNVASDAAHNSEKIALDEETQA